MHECAQVDLWEVKRAVRVGGGRICMSDFGGVGKTKKIVGKTRRRYQTNGFNEPVLTKPFRRFPDKVFRPTAALYKCIGA